MSRGTYLLIAILVLGLSVFFISGYRQSLFNFGGVATTIPSPTETGNLVNSDFFSCLSDDECISVRADNCGCTAGGKATAINKKFKISWEEKHPREICPQVLSDDWTCINAIPKCLSNKCQLVREIE